jgi:hypothetical protein
MAMNFKIKTSFEAIDKIGPLMKKMGNRIQRFADRTKKALKRVGRVAKAVGKAMGRWLKRGLLAAGAGIAAFGVALDRVTARVDTLAKKARSIDFPIEEFQEWTFVAEQSGVAGDKFQTTMQKFAKNVGDAKSGTGTLTTILRKNDRQFLKQLKTTESVDQAFEMYIARLREIDDPARQAALANAAFGRTGVDMLNIVNTSAEGVEELRKQMRENGVVTAEQAKKAEEYRDMMNRVKLTLASLAVDVLAPMIPTITKLLDQFREWIGENRELIAQRANEYFNKVVGAIKNMYNWVVENKDEIKAFALEVLDLAKQLMKLAKWLWQNKEAVLAIGVALKALSFANALSGLGSISSSAAGATASLKGTLAMLGRLGAVGAAGAAGAAIGTVYKKAVLDPAEQAQQESSRGFNRLLRQQSLNAGRMGGLKRQSQIEFLQGEIERKTGIGARGAALFTGESDTLERDVSGAREVLGQLQAEQVRGARSFLGGIAVKASEKIEGFIEVNINDPKGNATVGKTKGKNINTKHTAGAEA